MNSTAIPSTLTSARSGSRSGGIHVDTVTIGLVLAIVLLGLVMVTSASISIATKETGDAFFYLERQLILPGLGRVHPKFATGRAGPRRSLRRAPGWQRLA